MADQNPFGSNSVEAPKFGDTFDADPDTDLAPLVNEAEALRIIEQARIENRRAKMAAKGVPDPTLGVQPHPLAPPSVSTPSSAGNPFSAYKPPVQHPDEALARAISHCLELRGEYRTACQHALALAEDLDSPLREPLEALLRIVLED